MMATGDTCEGRQIRSARLHTLRSFWAALLATKSEPNKRTVTGGGSILCDPRPGDRASAQIVASFR
jgi:hypothetical protein